MPIAEPRGPLRGRHDRAVRAVARAVRLRSEEHTSELQSRLHLVCRLLLEKKKKRSNSCRRTSPVLYLMSDLLLPRTPSVLLARDLMLSYVSCHMDHEYQRERQVVAPAHAL